VSFTAKESVGVVEVLLLLVKRVWEEKRKRGKYRSDQLFELAAVTLCFSIKKSGRLF